MAQNHFPGTPPADRHEIADAAADHQARRSILMAEVTVRVENRSGEQTVAKFKRDQLTAVEMPGKNQVVATATRRFPDARVVRAEDLNVALG